MAKRQISKVEEAEPVIDITVGPDDFGEDEDTHVDAPEEVLSPLSETILELEAVAEGGSMAKVVAAINRVVASMSIEECQAYLVSLARLKGAAERAASVAQEAVIGKR